jgi:hypothetical protein
MKHRLTVAGFGPLFALLSLISLAGCTSGATQSGATATPSTAQDSGPWEIVLQKNIEQPMRIAAFLDGSFGVTGGPSDPGRAHYTTDGGVTWTMAESSAA